MAFDHSAQYQAADASTAVNRELGRAYIEPGSEGEPSILDARRAVVLEAWSQTLLPGDEFWPSGVEVPVVGYVDHTIALAPRLRPSVLRALDAIDSQAEQMFGCDFVSASESDRTAILEVLEASSPLETTLIKELAYEVYYRDPAVLRVVRERTGFDSRLPVDGIEMPSYDRTVELLAEIAERPSTVREVPR